MKKGKLPKIKQLQDQTGRVLWWGDENTNDAQSSSEESRAGDIWYWVRDGKKERMGFLYWNGFCLKYHKDSSEELPPPRWTSQVKAKPGEVAICVGGK